MKKKIFSLFLLLTLPFIASGQVKIGELWYVLSGTEAEVTFARDTYRYRHADMYNTLYSMYNPLAYTKCCTI